MAGFKKNIKILFINIAIIIAIFSVIEFLAFKFPPKEITDYRDRFNTFAEKVGWKKLQIKYMKMVPFNLNGLKQKDRPTLIGNTKKRPILLLGCSFAHGAGLNNNQTLSYKLYKLTNRTTYNKGIAGCGAQHMLYQLEQKDFYKKVPDAEYIIYIFIWDHLQRLYGYYISPYSNMLNLRYDFKNGKLQEVKPIFLPFYSLFSVKRVQDYIKLHRSMQDEKSFELFTQIMVESKKLTDKQYPNSKFVILLYKDSGKCILNREQINTLKGKGFIVIDSEKLVSHELLSAPYRIGDKEHPSEKAWDEIAPKLVKTLKL